MPGGFAGGFVNGAGTSLIYGDNIFDAYGKGLEQGFIGGFSGTVLGGIGGGLDAYRDGRNFWSGNDPALNRGQFALRNTDKFIWDVPNDPTMTTQYDCVPTSLARQTEMLGDPYGYDMLVKDLSYNVNVGYNGRLGDFPSYVFENLGGFVELEQISINQHNISLIRNLAMNNTPVGHLTRVGGSNWHYSTLKSVTFTRSGNPIIRVSDPGGFIKRVFSGFYLKLVY